MKLRGLPTIPLNFPFRPLWFPDAPVHLLKCWLQKHGSDCLSCHEKRQAERKASRVQLGQSSLDVFTQGKSPHIVPRYFINAPTDVKIEVDLSFLWDIHALRRSFIKGASVTFLSTSVQSGHPAPCQYRAYSDAQGVAREFKWGWCCSWLYRTMPEDL